MGGLEGLRGYYYQVLAVLIDGIANEDWLQVSLEADTSNDKVDILWEWEDAIQAVQVKSSINNITIGQIRNWLVDLMDDTIQEYRNDGFNSLTYRLFLIGSFNHDTNAWIRKVQTGQLDLNEKAETVLEPYEHELKNVQFKTFNADTENLRAGCIVSLSKFIEREYHNPGTLVVEQICDSLIRELIEGTMLRKPLTRKRLSSRISAVIESSQFLLAKNNHPNSNLSLAFYEKGVLDESVEMEGMKLSTSVVIQQYITETEELLKKALDIETPYIDSMDPLELKEKNSTLSILDQLNQDRKVSFSLEDVSLVLKYAPHMKNIQIVEKDINVGNLKENNNIFREKTLKGTEAEQKKYNIFVKVFYNLFIIDELSLYFQHLESYFVIPLIIKNEGAIGDDNIRVLIEFPPEASVIVAEELPKPPEFLIDYLLKDDYFLKILKPKKAAIIEDYHPQYISYIQAPIHFNLPGQYRNKFSDVDFEKYCENWFEYNHSYEDKKDFLEYEIKQLKSGAKMIFPTYIFISAEDNITIRYNITSNKMNKSAIGELKWLHPSLIGPLA